MRRSARDGSSSGHPACFSASRSSISQMVRWPISPLSAKCHQTTVARRSPDRAGMPDARATAPPRPTAVGIADACADDLLDHAFDQQAIEQVGLGRIDRGGEIAGGRRQTPETTRRRMRHSGAVAHAATRAAMRAGGEARHTARPDHGAPARRKRASLRCASARLVCGFLRRLFARSVARFRRMSPAKADRRRRASQRLARQAGLPPSAARDSPAAAESPAGFWGRADSRRARKRAARPATRRDAATPPRRRDAAGRRGAGRGQEARCPCRE